MGNSLVARNIGYEVSKRYDYDIPTGEDGSENDILVLDKSYTFLLVQIQDPTELPADCTISFLVSPSLTGDLSRLFLEYASAEYVTSVIPNGDDTPIQFFVKEAIGVRRLLVVLSDDAAAGCEINIYGVDQSVS